MRFRIHWHHTDGHTEETEHEAVAPTTLEIPPGVEKISVEDLDRNVAPSPPEQASDTAAGLTP